MSNITSENSGPASARTIPGHGEWQNTIKYMIIGVEVSMLAFLIIFATYYIYKFLSSYMGSRGYATSISFPNNNINENKPIQVGETIVLKLAISKLEDNQQETLCTPIELEFLNSNLNISFYLQNKNNNDDGKYMEVAVLKTFTPNRDAIMIRFSLRKSGTYKIYCRYWRWFNFMGSPSIVEVQPGSFCVPNTILQVQNPECISVTVDQWILLPLVPRDRYGNSCIIQDEEIDKFGFVVKRDGVFTDSHPDLNWKFQRQENEFFLSIKTRRCQIFKCMLTFMKKAIEQNVHSPSFLILSMSMVEEHSFRAGFSNYFSLGHSSTQAKLLFLGVERQIPSVVNINITYKNVAFSSLHCMGWIPYPFLAFYINRRTKISLVGPHSMNENENNDTGNEDGNNNDESNNVCLKIADGIQESATFSLTASQARILLATFSHYKGHKLKRLSFLEKQSILISELQGVLPNMFKSTFVMAIDDKTLLVSSIEKSPKISSYWLKPFIIGCITASSSTTSASAQSSGLLRLPGMTWNNAPLTKPFPTDQWLTKLIEILFNGDDNDGLFIKNSGSGRLHPNLGSRRKSRTTLKEMEFAGTIVGKYINDSICYNVCVNITYLKFTKSFLASLIGIPVMYKYFETDYPTFYENHVKPLLSNESEKIYLNFETPKGFEVGMGPKKSPSSEKVGLIPDGNNIAVTQSNKIHYLNLLALHILKNRHELEIQAFRSGFFNVIPQGLIADFDIDELERLICGGGSEFLVKDLKINHRVVGDLLDHAGISDTDLPRYNFSELEQRKILRWFWIIVSNMSHEEKTKLLSLVTGSSALPTCGFKDLVPKFTISLTGGFNQLPKYHQSLHLMSIGNHSSFERLEKNIIDSLHEGEDIYIVPKTLVDNAELNQRNSNSQSELNAQLDEDESRPWKCRIA